MVISFKDFIFVGLSSISNRSCHYQPKNMKNSPGTNGFWWISEIVMKTVFFWTLKEEF